MPAEAGDIGKTLQLTCYLGEGIATRRDIIEDGGGSVTKGVTYDNQIKLGDAVIIWDGSLAKQWPIVTKSNTDVAEPTTTNSGGILGVVISQPFGPVPAIAADGGTATLSDRKDMRTAEIEFVGYKHVRRGVVAEVYPAGVRLGFDASVAQFSANTSSLSWFPYVLLESSTAAGTFSVMLP